MKLFTDYKGRAVRLTVERLEHILEHPEMTGMTEALEATLATPELVIRSRSDSPVVLSYRFYRDTRMGDKWLCVVVRYADNDAFVLAAYLTDRPKKGERIWPTK